MDRVHINTDWLAIASIMSRKCTLHISQSSIIIHLRTTVRRVPNKTLNENTNKERVGGHLQPRIHQMRAVDA